MMVTYMWLLHFVLTTNFQLNDREYSGIHLNIQLPTEHYKWLHVPMHEIIGTNASLLSGDEQEAFQGGFSKERKKESKSL